MISSPRWLAVHPVTPILAPGFRWVRKRPISLKSLATGFSRTEQVLMMIRSASSSLSVGSYPSFEESSAIICSVSRTFMAQPRVSI